MVGEIGVFIISQPTASTTPPVTVVCPSTSFLTMTVTMAHTLKVIPLASGQHYVVLPPLLIMGGHRKCFWPCHHGIAATSVPNASSVICQLYHGSSAVKLLFQN